MIKFKNRFQYKAHIDITSLVDLVFLLIAFFMITSSLSTTSSISVQLPKAVQSGDQKQGDITITVDEKNNVYINDVKYEPDSLLNEFKKRKAGLEKNVIIIKGDRNANYETIVKVMDTLNQAGLPRFSLTTIKSR
ncbi:MAG: biopolymer transporter ExbD [Spirochaetes bacterium]|nr:biopolymer transporter ExbD [Spirochaetota bacterium]